VSKQDTRKSYFSCCISVGEKSAFYSLTNCNPVYADIKCAEIAQIWHVI